MVENITEKVVKRLVQVTSAMKQDGENRVGLIRSQTAKKVSQKLAEASAARPAVVGATLNEIGGQDEEILHAVLDVMETEKLLESQVPRSRCCRRARRCWCRWGGRRTPQRRPAYRSAEITKLCWRPECCDDAARTSLPSACLTACGPWPGDDDVASTAATEDAAAVLAEVGEEWYQLNLAEEPWQQQLAARRSACRTSVRSTRRS